jgi:hypothetical protein
MTDQAPEPILETAPPPADTGEPTTPEEWRAKYERATQAHIRERNLWKPVAQSFRDLDDGERNALFALADAVRNGDADAIVDWSLATAENVSGKGVADLIASRQSSQSMGETTSISSAAQRATEQPAAQLDPVDIQKMVADALVADRAQQARQAEQDRIIGEFTTQMRAGGYEPGSPAGRAIIQICRENGGDMGLAIQTFNSDVLAQAQSAARAVAGAAGQTPAPSPNGVPVGSMPVDLSPKERMKMRLSSQNG